MSFMLPTILAVDIPNPVEHVVDKPLIETNFAGYHGWLVSNVTVMLVLAGIVTAITMITAARRIATGKTDTIDDFRAQGLHANFVEAICLYLRNDVFKPALGEDTDRFTPFLWTLFWFILSCNLLGLLPIADVLASIGILIHHPIGHGGHGIGGTATQSIWVTAGLAFVSFLVINISGFKKDPIAYFKHLTGGTHPLMWIIMVPVEILGTFVKPFALAMRLFANMTGGHIVLAIILSFVYLLVNTFHAVGYGLSLAPLLGALFVYSLELMIAFIQAFVFTFLTCLFIGQLIAHHGDDHGHGHDHAEHGHEGHDHAHGHAH